MSLKQADVSTFMSKVKKQIEENNKEIEKLTQRNQTLQTSLDGVSKLFEDVPTKSEVKPPHSAQIVYAPKASLEPPKKSTKRKSKKEKSVPDHIQALLKGRKTGMRPSEILKALKEKGIEGSDKNSFKPRIYQAVKNLYERGLLEANDTGDTYGGKSVYTYTLA